MVLCKDEIRYISLKISNVFLNNNKNICYVNDIKFLFYILNNEYTNKRLG